MKKSSRTFIVPARLSLAATCAVVLGTAATFAQSTGASSSPSNPSTNTDRYGSGSSTTSSSTDTPSTTTKKKKRGGSSTSTDSAASTDATGSTSTYGSSSSTTPSSSTYGQSGTPGSGSSTYGSGSTSGQAGSSGTYGTSHPSGSSSNTAYGTTSGSTSYSSTEKLGWGDRRFLTKAADSGMTELQLAQLASEKASNPEVRSFAQKLIQAHQTVNSELISLAGTKNVKMDDDDGKDRHYKRLAKKSGSEFDQEFVEHMIDMHQDDVKLFEKAAQDAKDSDLRSFASKHVGHLREHLQSAESLRQTIMPTGRMDDDRSGRSTPGGTTNSGSASGQNGTSSTSSSSSINSSDTSGSSASSPSSNPHGSGGSATSGTTSSGTSGSSSSSTKP